MSENTPGTEHPAATTETPVITPPSTIVTVDTQSLQTALAKYVKVVANKNARLPVQGIRISAAADRLDLLGTDLEVSLHVTVPATVATASSNAIVADYKALLYAVKAVRDRQTRLALYEEYLLVSDSGSSTHVSSYGEVGDFPQLPRRLTLEECLVAREENAPEYQKQNAVDFEKMKKSWRETLPLEFQEFCKRPAIPTLFSLSGR